MSLTSEFKAHAADPDRVIGDEGKTMLHLAAKEGDYAAASLALQAHASVAVQDKEKNTPVIYAAQRGDVSLLRLLLADDNSSINHAGNLGTALGIAAASGELEVVATLLEFGADIHAKDKDGGTALHAAIFAEQKPMIDFLLKKGANASALRDNNETTLHLGVRTGDVDILEALFAHGAAKVLQQQTKEKLLTPLHIAVMTAELAAARCLLDHGAFTNIRNSDKLSPLDVAAHSGDTVMTRLLVETGCAELDKKDGSGTTPLHRAIYEGKEAEVRELVRLGADPYVADDNKRTPLHIAAWKGNMALVKFFAEEVPPQEDITAQKQSRAQALYDAVFYDHDAVADYLMSLPDVTPNVPTIEGRLPLAHAIEDLCAGTGSAARVEALLQNGANPDVTGKDGDSLLQICAKKNETEGARLLLKYGANTEFTEKGEVPLLCAIEPGHLKMVELLTENGANPLAKNANNVLTIDLARMKSHAAIVPVLESAIMRYVINQNTSKPQPFTP